MDNTSRMLYRLSEMDGFIMYKYEHSLVIEAEGHKYYQGGYCMEEFVENAFLNITAHKIAKQLTEFQDGK